MKAVSMLSCVALAIGAQAARTEEGYGHLPSEQVCAYFYKQCEDDCRDIMAQMELVGGWQRQQLAEMRCEAERLRAIWYAAWWIAWKDAQQAQRDEWAGILIGHLGQHAFWRAEVPLPISLRGY